MPTQKMPGPHRGPLRKLAAGPQATSIAASDRAEAAHGASAAVALSPYHPMMATALEKGLVGELERLYELQVQWEAREARNAFYRDMAAFQAECPPILKTRQGAKSRYAALEDIEHTIKEVRTKYGFSVSYCFPGAEQSPGWLYGYAIVRHRQGHMELLGHNAVRYLNADSTRGGMNQTQADAGTVTYLQRYILKTAFNLTFEGEDTDAHLEFTGGSVTAEQLLQLKEFTDRIHTPDGRMYTFGDFVMRTITKPEQLTHKQATTMINGLKHYLEEQESSHGTTEA